MTKKNKIGIYVHIPYCIKKCNYCDFVSRPLADVQSCEGYFDKLACDIAESGAMHPDVEADSIFFGGGTPSCVDEGYICGILNALKYSFSICNDAETSIEMNPGTVDEQKLAAYKSAGFNRISIGVQSLDDGILKSLGRIHDAQTARSCFLRARSFFANINIDMMFGVPGQSFEIWKRDLDEVIGWGPEHISFYSLQLEEGTPFFDWYKNGRIALPEWEENRRMYHYAVDALKRAGYVHYEVSNAAKPGFECRHNLKYWTMQPYLGFGESAHGFFGGMRCHDGECEMLSQGDLKGDFIFTQMRLIAGLDKDLYRELFGSDFDADYGSVTMEQVRIGNVFDDPHRLRFTEKGLDNTNGVLSAYLNMISADE